MDATKLVHMANQIAQNFRVHAEPEAVRLTTEHLRSFWSPGMRQVLLQHVDAGGAGLEPLAAAAARALRPAPT